MKVFWKSSNVEQQELKEPCLKLSSPENPVTEIGEGSDLDPA